MNVLLGVTCSSLFIQWARKCIKLPLVYINSSTLGLVPSAPFHPEEELVRFPVFCVQKPYKPCRFRKSLWYAQQLQSNLEPDRLIAAGNYLYPMIMNNKQIRLTKWPSARILTNRHFSPFCVVNVNKFISISSFFSLHRQYLCSFNLVFMRFIASHVLYSFCFSPFV